MDEMGPNIPAALYWEYNWRYKISYQYNKRNEDKNEFNTLSTDNIYKINGKDNKTESFADVSEKIFHISIYWKYRK